MPRTKAPTMTEGFNTLSQALKDDILALVEASLKKTENGLKFLEKEVHKLKTKSYTGNKSVSTKKHTPRKNATKQNSRKR